MTDAPTNGRLTTDSFFRIIVGIALTLAFLHGVLLPIWGGGPALLVVPVFIPISSSFMIVTALCVAILAFGRYHVLRTQRGYWIGLAFATYGLGLIFYILTWPGLLPDGGSVLGQRPNTSAVFGSLAGTAFGLTLLGAALLEPPQEQAPVRQRWGWGVIAWLALVTLFGCCLLLAEASLPILVQDDGRFTPLLLGWNVAQAALFAAGAIVSARTYLRTREHLLGYVSICQQTYAVATLASLIGARRYDLWWYFDRVVLVGGFLVVLAGVLAEYVQLLRREREQAVALRARSEELEVVLNAVPAVVWIAHDPACQVISGNRAAYELLQMRPSQNLSKTAAPTEAPRHFRVYQHGVELAPEALPVQQAAVRGEEIRDFEEEIVFDDGSVSSLLGNATPLRDEHGRVRGAVAAFLDITARRRAEAEREALLARVGRLQTVTAALVEALTPEQVGDVLVQQLMEALGAQTVGLALWEEGDARLRLVKTAGYPADVRDAWELQPIDAGTPLADCVLSGRAIYLESPAELAARYPALGQAAAALGVGAWAAVPLHSGGQRIGGLRLTFANQRPFTAEEQAFIVNLAQQGATALERARLYAIEHRARTEAEAAVLQREEFLAIAAHELKTPLTSLLGFTQLFQMRARQNAQLSERDRAGVELIRTQSQRLERMVTRLLDLSRLNQGRLQLERADVDLEALIGRSVAEITPMSARHHLVFRDSAGPLIVEGDELRLTQVVQNLLENAIKYSPRGGSITVTLTPTPHHAQVAVKDEGIGIPAADLPYVWQRFYRAYPFRGFGRRGCELPKYRFFGILVLWTNRSGQQN